MYAGGRNVQGCLYLTVRHMTILHYQFTRGIKILVIQCTLVVIIHVESCKKGSNENAHELIPFFCQINFFKALLTTQMTLVRQNILSTVMLKNDKLSNGIVRLHLATPGQKVIEQFSYLRIFNFKGVLKRFQVFNLLYLESH